MSQGQGGGQPTKYDKKYNVLVKGLALLGYTDAMISEHLEITESTLNLWKLEYPKFSESIKAGRVAADIPVINALRKRALGFDYDEVTYEVKGDDISFDEENFSNKKVAVKKTVKKKALADVTAQRIYLMNRQRLLWGAENKHELTGKDGADLFATMDLSRLSDDEIAALIPLLNKAKGL